MILPNYAVTARNTVTHLGNAYTNPFQQFKPEAFVRFYTPDCATAAEYTGRDKSAFNNGYAVDNNGGECWHLSPKAGGLSSCNEVNGTGTLTAAQSNGINLEGPLTGSGDLSGNLALIVSLAAALDGTGDVTADLQARLSLAADLAGSGDLAGGLSLLAGCVADLTGTGSVTADARGTLSMSADIVVNQSDATSAQIAAAVWAKICEGTYDYGDVLRIVAAACAGKTSNTGQTFRDLSDTKDRITGTVSGGDRTAATYDPD